MPAIYTEISDRYNEGDGRRTDVIGGKQANYDVEMRIPGWLIEECKGDVDKAAKIYREMLANSYESTTRRF